MKIEQSIIKDSPHFNKQVAKRMPSYVNDVYIHGINMIVNYKEGAYEYQLGIDINGETRTLSMLTKDVEDYFLFISLPKKSFKFDNWAKNRVLIILDDALENLTL